MRLAIATENGQVAQHFGRCPGFTIVDIDKEGKVISKNFIENPGHKAHQPGAVPRFLKSQNVDFVVAGGMGPNAVHNLQTSGIRVIVGVSGSIDDTISKFLIGSLKGGESLCEHGEHRHGGCRH